VTSRRHAVALRVLSPFRTRWTGATRSTNERGAAAVEFAMVLPLLVTLMLGSIDVGFVLSDNTKLRAVTRETTRHAAVGQFGRKVCPGTYQSANLPLRDQSLANPDFGFVNRRERDSEHVVCLAKFYGADAGLDVRAAVRVSLTTMSLAPDCPELTSPLPWATPL
jgi:Flp pilus assembly pilin Flp